MKMKVENDKFYIVQAADEKIIHTTRPEAVETLKELVAKGKDVDPEKTYIIEVDTSKEKWSLQQVPWSQIAIELIRKGGK
jgi:hypothetical protein